MANVIALTSPARRALAELAESAPEWTFGATGELCADFVDHVRRRTAEEPELASFAARAREELATAHGKPGYVVVDGLIDPNGDEESELKKATVACALMGRPFRMIERLGFWQELGVNFAAAPYRFGGIGYNPLHIDGVNTTRPPDYVILLCFRKDPAGGGANLVASLQRMVGKLADADRMYLSQTIFREGEYFGVSGVGPELNPFPVLAPLAGGWWRVRITGKILPELPPCPERELLGRALDLLAEEQLAILLNPGQALVVNQLLMAHGREELGPDQSAIPADRRRYFRQSYFSADSWVRPND